jgi:hypothetical protein
LRNILCIAVLTAGITLGAPAAHAAPARNPCTLLSLAEAQSVTHFTLTSPDPNPMRADGGSDKDTTCGYMNDSENQSVTVVWHDDTAYFPGNAKAGNTEGYKRIAGIGQRAWTVANAMAVSVEILKNGQYVSVRVTDPNGLKDRGARNYADAIQLAKLVAGRL